MMRLFMLVAIIVMALTMAAPALAQDLSSAKELPPPNTDYQITSDGYLILEGDIVYPCESLRFPNYDVKQYESYPPESQAKIRSRYKEEYEALAKACTEAGFPPADTLPRTGGVPFVLVPVGALLGGALLIRTIASR